jgi:hypothetical protein
MQSPSRLVWSIALPAMLTNVATALSGLADMRAIGRLGDAAAQGAVERRINKRTAGKLRVHPPAPIIQLAVPETGEFRGILMIVVISILHYKF